MSIGENIKKYRKEKNLNQQQLADLLDISKSTLTRYEGDKTVPSPRRLSNIAQVLDVDLKDIQGDFIYESEVNVILGTSGSGSDTAKISIPVTWLDDMGIDRSNTSVTIAYIDEKIVIEKNNK
ncbi:MAG: helix-turn-helix transcriptional regulator [Clostridium sp.]|uniref:helix-turn-helix domain-containing protein n=1 Tax=Clostridium sp. TaxID=1506 RepID=UPI001F190085|nr:helix-turn-helix transcriptional regulator [Clostridium sp.]MDU4844008.1 helix-turn-helix transcriptional regulator [Leclercia adecarboxylata]MDU7089570.1 helix-turn-helix transcriptional regulator [Clostridium sp.]